MSDDMTIDDLTFVGIDGIRRTFDEHYDTMMCVEQDPTGAHHAIHNQHARIEELEGQLIIAMKALTRLSTSEVYGNGEALGCVLSSDPMGREIVARMEYARDTIARIKGE